jgi:membrane protein
MALPRRISGKFLRFRYRLMEYTSIRFLVALVKEIGEDDIATMAAGIAYYAFLSIFPLLMALLAIFGIIMPSEAVQREIIHLISQILPGFAGVLETNVADIIRLRGTFGVIGIIGLVWSGTGVFSAVSNSINKAWDIRYRHPFYINKPREIIMILCVGILLLLSFGASGVLSLLGNLGLPLSSLLVNIGTAVIAFILSLAIFMLINKSAPISWINWRHVWPGAVLSTALFEIAKTIFVIYLNNYSSYDEVYGSIASVIALLVWVYYSSFILLLGAEFNSMLHRWEREGDVLKREETKDDLVKDI